MSNAVDDGPSRQDRPTPGGASQQQQTASSTPITINQTVTFWSTVVGKVSLVNPTNGSFFVNELVMAFKNPLKINKGVDVLGVVDETIDKLSRRRLNYMDNAGNKIDNYIQIAYVENREFLSDACYKLIDLKDRCQKICYYNLFDEGSDIDKFLKAFRENPQLPLSIPIFDHQQDYFHARGQGPTNSRQQQQQQSSKTNKMFTYIWESLGFIVHGFRGLRLVGGLPHRDDGPHVIPADGHLIGNVPNVKSFMFGDAVTLKNENDETNQMDVEWQPRPHQVVSRNPPV